MVGVDNGWAPRKPFINYSLHGVFLFIATLALFGRFHVLVFPSLLPHPWIMGNALPVMRLRRGGPSNTVCLNKGEGGISLFPPIAVVSFLLTSFFAQGCVAHWLRAALGP
jgi:hypothetical protein